MTWFKVALQLKIGFLLLLTIVACGQKGDLYLPQPMEDQPSENHASENTLEEKSPEKKSENLAAQAE